MDDELGPTSEFLTPPISAVALVSHRDWSPTYPYHVVDGQSIVFRSRSAHEAREVAEQFSGQLWRTPLHPRFPTFCVCDFGREAWQAA
jgi:hypothetical protein